MTMDRDKSRSDPADLVQYPLLLRPGCWVFLKLPREFTRADRERLVRWLDVLVVPEEAHGEAPEGAKGSKP
jgi:hypothetical protein